MVNIDHVSAADLRSVLEQTDSRIEVLRLIVALNYKHGVSQTDIAEMYGISRKTVYNWLTRLEEQRIEDAIRDANRPGRPPKLSPAEWDRFEAFLTRSPETYGVEATRWTPSLVQQLLLEEFEVEYSRPHIRRLLQTVEAGPTQR